MTKRISSIEKLGTEIFRVRQRIEELERARIPRDESAGASTAAECALEELVAQRTAELIHTNQLLMARIEETHAALANIEDSAHRLKNTQRLARLGSWELDLAKNEASWSDEMYDIFQLPPGTCIDEPTFLSRLHPDDREAALELVTAAIADDRPYDQEYRVVLADGAVRNIHSVAQIARDIDGRPSRLVGTAQDITDRVRSEQQEREIQRQLLEAQKLESLGVLAGGIAHDFNNLLTAILGNAELALDETSTQDGAASSNLKEIIKAATQAAALTNQMLAYSGKGHFEIRPNDINAIIDEIKMLLRSSVSRKADLCYNLEPGLPAVEADAVQLRQVILNLVSNASDAIGAGPGRITIQTKTATMDRQQLDELFPGVAIDGGPQVVLEVADTGCGMDDEVRAKIFEPFFTTKFTGRGLGLAAVQGIIGGHGGALQVVSRPGRGSTFRIVLPRSKSAPDPLMRQPAEAPPWQGNGRVLLADDEPIVRQVARRMLEKLGFEVLETKNGAEAVQLFSARAAEITCVLLDLKMPVMDGKEALAAIAAICPQVPIILSSGFGEEEVTRGELQRGLAGFVQKPYKLSALARVLRRALEP